jgi:hypothetical protein
MYCWGLHLLLKPYVMSPRVQLQSSCCWLPYDEFSLRKKMMSSAVGSMMTTFDVCGPQKYISHICKCEHDTLQANAF